MTKIEIETVLKRVQGWPLDQQELLARFATTLEEQRNVPRMQFDADTKVDITEGFAQIERGEIASDDEVEAAFARFRK